MVSSDTSLKQRHSESPTVFLNAQANSGCYTALATQPHADAEDCEGADFAPDEGSQDGDGAKLRYGTVETLVNKVRTVDAPH